MDINKLFASEGKYLKAADIRQVTPVTIARVVVEELGRAKERKPVAYFRERRAGLVLNKTNAMRLAEALGPETDGWTNKQIVLMPEVYWFGEERVDSIRVALPDGQLPQDLADELDDPIDDLGLDEPQKSSRTRR